MKIEKILFSTDFSAAAGHALRHAAAIAGETGAALTILHIRTLHGDQGDPIGRFPSQQQILSELEKRADPEFRQKLKGIFERGLGITTRVEKGISAADRILQVAREDRFGLVVIGRHGISELAHFFLGSTTEKVVRFSSVPVLTVGESPDYFDRRGVYQELLVPVDFSPTLDSYVEYAAFFGALYASEIHMLHVIEEPGYPEFYGMKLDEKKLPLIKEKAEEKLAALARERLKPPLKIRSTEARVGKAASVITRYAEERGIDLIVMGNRGLDRGSQLLLGDTAENIVRKAACPVLTVPVG
jgi:nucleotide-binding universal stress UspA family protein